MRWNSNHQSLLGETRIVIFPMLGPSDGIDITGTIIDAIAEEIARHCAGNEVLNRLEAESLLANFLDSMTPAKEFDGEMT